MSPEDLFRAVCDEMQAAGVEAEHFTLVALYCSRWRRRPYNPSWMDMAARYLCDHGLPVTEGIRAQLEAAGQARLLGGIRCNPKKVRKQIHQDAALRRVADKLASGEPLQAAAEDAAHWIEERAGYAVYAPSSLESYYRRHLRSPECGMPLDYYSCTYLEARALADPTTHLSIQMAVDDELLSARLEVRLAVSLHIKRAVKTGNAFYMDAAVISVCQGYVPFTESIRRHLGAFSYVRLFEKHDGGNSGSAVGRELTSQIGLEKALTLMLNLRACGFTLKKAALKAAGWLENTSRYAHYKASTLERYYTEQKMRPEPYPDNLLAMARARNIVLKPRPTEEEEWFAFLARSAPDHANHWDPIIDSFPDASPERRGERR